MKVYISGPITGLPVEVYREAFAARARWVEAQGWKPVNPCDLTPGRCECAADVEHGWSCYIKEDLAALLECDAITTLPGWHQSNGARAEVFVAGVVGLQFVEVAS